MKTSLLTATGCLAVVTLMAAGARAQSYQPDHWDGYRNGTSNSSSYGSSYTQGYTYGTPQGNSQGTAYSNPSDPYGRSYNTRQNVPYGTAQSNPHTPGYGQPNPGYYQAPAARPGHSMTSGPTGPTGPAQPNAPQPEAAPQIMHPGYGSVADSYDGSYGVADDYGSHQTKPVQWMVAADLMFMTRVPGNTYALLKVPSPTPPPPLSFETVALDVADFDFDYEPGWRITASRMVCDGWGVEAGFFAMADGWDYGTTMDGILELQGPGWSIGSDPDLLPAPTPVHFRVQNTSEFYSGELNVVRGICDWATLRMGVRYIEFNDRLEVDELYTPLYNLLISTTDNNLIGTQMGADFKLFELKGGGGGVFGGHRGHAGGYGLGHGASCGCDSCCAQSCCRFRLNAMVNCGVFYNHVKHDPYSAFIGPPLLSEANEVALLGEAGLTAKYRLTDHVAIRGGYHILAIHGVALAPDQIATSDVVTETTSTKMGSLISHGATLGVEVFW